MFESISVNELKSIDNPSIIDLRSIEKYNNGHILNARNISMEQLIISPQKYMNKNDKYYVYCQKGIQSRKICQILFTMGYNVVNIKGGYESWILNQ